MNIAFYIAHPSQYYVFKQLIFELKNKGHKPFIFIKTKDILETLLLNDNIEYINVFKKKKNDGFFSLLKSVITKNIKLLKYFKKFKINLLVTAASDSCQASFLLGIPSIVLNDDDAAIIKNSTLFGWPFSSVILAPEGCEMGSWGKKTIKYKGFQKLAYLHPKYFKPNKEILKKYNLHEKNFFIIRTVSLTAHHDKNIRGLDNELVKRIIKNLSDYGDVYISSENELPYDLSHYKLSFNPSEIHHIMYYAKLLIGDSQSMAHEAALLGTPSIRFNDFVGKIGVLNILENKYDLTIGILPDNKNLLLQKVKEFISKEFDPNKTFKLKTQKMLKEMIDVPAFLNWFIENYPESARIMKENPDYQYNFK